MILFPAIDLKNGKCVRLEQGDFNKVQIFGEDPIAMAKHWQEEGGQYLHVVDLDGALSGHGQNGDIIKKIAQVLDIPVQTGGGIRTLAYAEELLAAGVQRVILGTSALSDPLFTRTLLEKYGPRVALSIDAKGGMVAVKGWTEVSEQKAVDLVKQWLPFGLETVVYTDIAKDGMMAGPNFTELAALQKACAVQIIASGGVTTPADVARLRQMELYGAIIGKALYTGSICLPEVLA